MNMANLYVYLLVILIVASYTYCDTKSYSSKESRLIHVFLNSCLAVIATWFISIIFQVLYNIFGK